MPSQLHDLLHQSKLLDQDTLHLYSEVVLCQIKANLNELSRPLQPVIKGLACQVFLRQYSAKITATVLHNKPIVGDTKQISLVRPWI